ncbi:MAG TPA: FIST N-terminal domain-containing protein [Cytophagaceae bacterium]
MTISTVVFTNLKDSLDAGKDLGTKIIAGLKGKIPNVVILFASSVHNYEHLLKAIKHSCDAEIIVGCSSAGEFTSMEFDTDSATAVGIHSNEIKFSAGLGRDISKDRNIVADELFSALKGTDSYEYPYHSGLILADALSGYTDELIDILTERTVGAYQFFGGGAGDDAKFEKTHVFFGEQAFPDAAIILEILSHKPVGIGVRHGWQPTGKKMKVTESSGSKLISINATPAVEVFAQYANDSNQTFDPKNPIPFFLHNVIGIEMESGYKLRVPLAVQTDGSIICASDIVEGSIISFMEIGSDAATLAAEDATNAALQQLNLNKPSVALFFDCVATRLRMGREFEMELKKVKDKLDPSKYVGCNTYGQIARVDGQFSGFHNCTAVVCIIPE